MTPVETAVAVKAPVAVLGSAYSEDPRTLQRARQLGLTGWGFYVAGRGGVLGDVRPEIVAAAMGFIALDAVRDGWQAAGRVAPPADIAAATLAECCRWGRERLGGYPRLARFVALAERVVDGAEAAGLTLFAAWRAAPLPEDGLGARAAVLLHLLREHRGGVHLLAVRSVGLTPLEAVLSGVDGEAGALAFGWQPPYPPVTPLLRRRSFAEALTDRMSAESFAVLTHHERVDLVDLVWELRGAVPH